VWHVGDGSHIKIWEDNWIPRIGTKQPLGAFLNIDQNSFRNQFFLRDEVGMCRSLEPRLGGWALLTIELGVTRRTIFFLLDQHTTLLCNRNYW
jgi:hypothetical protein